jgi:hypothetical protein
VDFGDFNAETQNSRLKNLQASEKFVKKSWENLKIKNIKEVEKYKNWKTWKFFSKKKLKKLKKLLKIERKP